MTDTIPAAGHVAGLLAALGYDVTSNGLANTPRRVAAALAELTAGETEDPGRWLATVFDVSWAHDEMIALRGMDFASLCEHHLLPFTGTVTVAYIPAPGAGVVGVSKLARVVDGYARRLQVQERMTTQIADCLEKYLDTRGVAVAVRATHSCMSLRGVRKPGSDMVTNVLRGAFRDDGRVRSEFMALLGF
jgi:GTP cyclohydrolase I